MWNRFSLLLLWFLSFLYPFVGICWRLALFSFLFSFWILSSLWLVSSTSIVWLVDQMYLLDHRGCWHLSTDGLRCGVVLIKLTIVWEMSKNVACANDIWCCMFMLAWLPVWMSCSFYPKLEEFQFIYFRSLEEHNLIMLWIAKKLQILFSGSSVLSE